MSIKSKTNKGTGAGGSRTTMNGDDFENRTDMKQLLINDGFSVILDGKKSTDSSFFLMKQFDDRQVFLMHQNSFIKYIKKYHGFNCSRRPDEAYITIYNDGRKKLFIIEKKAQNCEGSVDGKIYSGDGMRSEYMWSEDDMGNKLCDTFEVKYAFVVNNWMMENVIMKDAQKNKHMRLKVVEEYGIPILGGDEPDYVQKLKHLIFN